MTGYQPQEKIMILLISNTNNLKLYTKFHNKFKNKSILCINNLSLKTNNVSLKYTKYYLEEKKDSYIKFFFTFSFNFFQIIKIFLFYKIEKVILVDNRSCSFFLLALKLSVIFGAKSYILNQDHPATKETFILNRKKYPSYTKVSKKIINNKISYEKKLLYYKKFEGYIYNLFNLSPKNQWSFSAENIDYVYYNSETQKKIYIYLGISTKKLIKFRNSKFRFNKNKLKNYKNALLSFRKKNNIDEKPILIYTLHQYVEHNLIPYKSGWQININITKNLSKYLSNDYNLLLSLHPKQKYENYVFLEKKYKIKILKSKFDEVAVFASLLFITNYSSIIDIGNIYNLKIFIFKLKLHIQNYSKFYNVEVINHYNEIKKILKTKKESYKDKYLRLKSI